MSEKLTLARIKKFGKNFEVSVDSDLALKFKKNELKDVREVLLSENVYSDAHKGLVVPAAVLKEVFGTDDVLKVAEIIIKEGEVQLSSEHRHKEMEQKKRQLIEMIHRQAVDPKTGYPHPSDRIEAALEQGKINFDYNTSVEEQFEGIISKLRVLLPLKIEQKKLSVEVPGQYAGKAYSIVTRNSKVLKEEWTAKGSWRVLLEIPAGFYFDFLNLLNSVCHGDVLVEEVKV